MLPQSSRMKHITAYIPCNKLSKESLDPLVEVMAMKQCLLQGRHIPQSLSQVLWIVILVRFLLRTMPLGLRFRLGFGQGSGKRSDYGLG